jgi:hypothetical protein
LRPRTLATAAAAVVVLGLSVSVALFANQPPSASAAEVLTQVEAEAVSVSGTSSATCQPPDGATQSSGGIIAIGSGPGQPGGPSGPISSANANQLSDKLAQALGVSGDQVRQAMRQTLSSEIPTNLPPDPMASIAQQLGVPAEQVCAAFLNPQSPGLVISGSVPDGKYVTSGGKTDRGVVVGINGTPINLNTVTADQLSGPAQKLGVTPDRLLAAVKASIPSPPPAPPSEDEIISRFAQNLGMSQDKVRAAITQVEGPNQFYFVVPIPRLGH